MLCESDMSPRGPVTRTRKAGDQHTFVPLLQLLLVKVCRVLQLLELLLRQLGLAVFTQKCQHNCSVEGAVVLVSASAFRGWCLSARGMMQWLVGPWSRGRKSKPQPRAGGDGGLAARQSSRPSHDRDRVPMARESKSNSDCIQGAVATRRMGSMECATWGILTIFPCLRRRRRPRGDGGGGRSMENRRSRRRRKGR